MSLPPTPDKIQEIQQLFNSIICLCVEGPECVSRRKLMDAILRKAEKGHAITKNISG